MKQVLLMGIELAVVISACSWYSVNLALNVRWITKLAITSWIQNRKFSSIFSTLPIQGLGVVLLVPSFYAWLFGSVYIIKSFKMKF